MTEEIRKPLLDQSNLVNKDTSAAPVDQSEKNQNRIRKHGYQMQEQNWFKSDGALNKYKENLLLLRTQSYPHLQTFPPTNKSRSQGNSLTVVPPTVYNNNYKDMRHNGTGRDLDKLRGMAFASAEDLLGSSVNLQNCVDQYQECESQHDATASKACCLTFKSGVSNVLGTLFDCKLLKSIIFIQYLTMAFVTMPGMILVSVFIPTYAKDVGIIYSKIAIILSVMSCLDIASKITFGVITDRQWIRRTTVLGVAAFVTGSMCHLTRFFSRFHSVLTISAIIGKCDAYIRQWPEHQWLRYRDWFELVYWVLRKSFRQLKHNYLGIFYGTFLLLS